MSGGEADGLNNCKTIQDIKVTILIQYIVGFLEKGIVNKAREAHSRRMKNYALKYGGIKGHKMV